MSTSSNEAARPERRRRMCKILDWVLAALIVAFAAILGAVPIRNSDAWVHLAVGRQLVNGPSTGGADPFLHSAATVTSISSSWGFDVVIYLVYSYTGSLGLGAFKVLMIALLACLLLWGARAGTDLLLPALGAALALVAASPWLQLQPILVSMVCLMFTLGYLERRVAPLTGDPAPVERASWATCWPLLVIFVVWVNADRWFVLGPLTLLIYWLGGLYPHGQVTRARIPALAVALGFAVCLANPRLYQAYRIPDELLLPVRYPELGLDALFRPLTLSLIGHDFLEAGFLWGAAGLSLALLLGCGVCALLFSRAGWHASRLILCASLLGLTLYQARNAPFLALALGVLVPRALLESLESYLRARPGIDSALSRGMASRFAAVVLGLAFVTLGWMGHLQSGRPQPRSLGIEADPSLTLAAERMAEWRRDGKIAADSLGLSDSPDAANYFAWFCPQEKGFFDSRLDVCGDAASDFVLVRRGLNSPHDSSSAAAFARFAPAATGWRDVLRRHKIDHIILADRDRERTQMVLRQVLASPDEWQVLFMAGRVLVLAWRDPAAKGATTPTLPGVDLAYEGLHPADAAKAPESASEPSSQASWWEPYMPVADRWSADRDEAALHNMMFEALIEPGRRAAAREWELALAAGIAGRAAGGELAGLALCAAWLADISVAAPRSSEPTPGQMMAQRLQLAYVALRDDAPVGHLWAAIRASRRALGDDSNDAEAYLLLGQMYCRLAWNTEERTWGSRSPALGQLRMQQAINALKQAIRIKPELDQAHSLLASIYRGLGFVDLALRHQQEFHKLHRERGPVSGESAAAFADRIDRAAQGATALETHVSDRETVFDRKQAGLTRPAQVRLAHSLGLTDKALNLLLETDPAAFNGEELHLALDLMLWTGRAAEGREWLKPRHKNLLGEFEYHSLGARLAAATGNYADAQTHLASLAARSAVVPELAAYPVDLEVGLAFVVGKAVLTGMRQAGHAPWLVSLSDLEPRLRVQGLSFALERTAEFDLLRGTIALERGDSDRAERHFRQALASSQHLAAKSAGFAAERGIHPIAQYYLRLLHRSPQESRPAAGGD